MFKVGWPLLTVGAILIGTTAPASAIVASVRSTQVLEQRVAELNASLVEIQAGLTQQNLAPSKQAALKELQKSFEAEKHLLLQRKELLQRLEAQGLLMYATPPEEKGK